MIKDKKKGMVTKQKEKIKKGQRNEKERVKGERLQRRDDAASPGMLKDRKEAVLINADGWQQQKATNTTGTKNKKGTSQPPGPCWASAQPTGSLCPSDSPTGLIFCPLKFDIGSCFDQR